MASIRDIHTDTTYTGRTPETITRRIFGRTAELRAEPSTGRYTVVRRAHRKHGDHAYHVLAVVTIQR